ncbi:MAG: hypothetical protein AAF581_08835 [Planctomycetota bacterium]
MRQRGFELALGLLLLGLLLWIPLLWIKLGFEEGFLKVLFLQTEASRSLSLMGSVVMLCLFVVSFLVFVVAGLFSDKRKKKTSTKEEKDSTDKPASSKRSSEPPSRSFLERPWAIRLQGLVYLAFGIGGLFFEYSKPGEERVWWVTIVFVFSMLCGIYELLRGKEW